ncbi:MAG: hypothetical protein SFT91_02455 [Rickettsiaceae bacterium]|nr:hypothetical protein [Rickettsiaceae bacterium]
MIEDLFNKNYNLKEQLKNLKETQTQAKPKPGLGFLSDIAGDARP